MDNRLHSSGQYQYSHTTTNIPVQRPPDIPNLGSRRKALRAFNACNSCRVLKCKCDEAKPVCYSCVDKLVECVYSLEKHPKADTGISTHLFEQFEQRSKAQFEEIKQLIHRVGNISQVSPPRDLVASELSPTSVTNSSESSGIFQGEETISGYLHLSKISPDPGYHTTGATRLLHVEAIAKLCKSVMDTKRIDIYGYPMAQECSRDLISRQQTGSCLENRHGLDFREDTVHRLVHSYETHMGILHPMLAPMDLHILAEQFLKQFAEIKKVGLLGGFDRKRKRCSTLEYQQEIFPPSPVCPFEVSRSALLLLVMALGKVCSHNGKLPDIASLPNLNRHSLHYPLSYSTSPAADTTPPPRVYDMHHTRISNIGLRYFVLATQIISDYPSKIGMDNIHINLLASLYCGQLGRIVESHRFLNSACYDVQVLLRPNLDQFKKIHASKIVPAEHNPIIFAFWTCLQLECDITAELPLPPSGILLYESIMPSPNLAAAGDMGVSARVIESYMAQLFLRKHINDVQDASHSPEYCVKQAEFLERDLIHSYAPKMRWNIPIGERATDILSARLRAKFYGAQVSAYRPFVLQVLRSSITSGRVETLSQEVLRYARLGILALVHSTTAFHSLGNPGTQRIIVTNIWGTAHAQWGNVLVLQAVFVNDLLSPLLLEIISYHQFRDLVEKTLSLLDLVADPSSALCLDRELLSCAVWESGVLAQRGV